MIRLCHIWGTQMLSKKAFVLCATLGIVMLVFWGKINLKTACPVGLIRTNDVAGNLSYSAAVDQDNKHKELRAQAVLQESYLSNLKQLGRDLKILSDSEIEREFERLKSEIYEKDLINLLNQGALTEHEQDKAQATFERLVMLGITKTERQLAALQPELEKVTTEHKARIKSARLILAD